MVYDAADGYAILFGGTSGWFPSTTTWIFANGSWTPLLLNPSPAGRDYPGMAYDAKDGYVVLFGGVSNGAYSRALGDTWKFTHGQWSQLSPKHSPSPREEPEMTYDTIDGYVLLYSSYYSSLHDTWSFASGQWKNITNYKATTGPPWSLRTYTFTTIAYDSTDQYVVLYGSNSYWGTATWTFRGGNWTNITGTAGTAPAARFQESFADDPSDGYLLFFGGSSWTRSFNDTHTFVAGTWGLLNVSGGPPGQAWSDMVYDNATAGIILFSWYDRATWEYSRAIWTQQDPVSAVSPSARYDSAMVEQGGGVLLFGGRTAGGGALGDTWWFFQGFWFNISSDVGVAPSPRFGATLTHDRGGEYLFGGTNGSAVFGDTWRFRGIFAPFPSPGAWRLVQTLVSVPPPRYDASAVENQVTHQIILFGGRNSTAFLNDTWIWSPRVGWSSIATGRAPPARSEAGTAYTRSSYPSPGNVTVFGGRNSSGILSDVWILYLGNWTLATPAGKNALPTAGAATAHTPNRTFGKQAGYFKSRPTIVFGGENGTALSNLTWRLIRDNWTLARSLSNPPPRAFASEALWFSYYSQRHSQKGILLFGGLGATGALSDTWLYLMN
jgi:hypothetical protein